MQFVEFFRNDPTAMRENPCREVYDCQHHSFLQCTSMLSPCAEYAVGEVGNYRCCESAGYESRFCHVKIGSCPEYTISTTFLDQHLTETHACHVTNPNCATTGKFECWWDAREKTLHWKLPEFLKSFMTGFMTFVGLLFVALVKLGIL